MYKWEANKEGAFVLRRKGQTVARVFYSTLHKGWVLWAIDFSVQQISPNDAEARTRAEELFVSDLERLAFGQDTIPVLWL